MAVSSEIVAPATWRGRNKGDEIRAKIAANRAKRLRIADAMKKEAGVTEHTIHHEDFGGVAYIGTGRIYSPEGRKIVQHYTLAHECGHIFLHNSCPGYSLPGHVKEFEAESYAHQAFREHGMIVPRKLSASARTMLLHGSTRIVLPTSRSILARWLTRQDGCRLTNPCAWCPRPGRSSEPRQTLPGRRSLSDGPTRSELPSIERFSG